MTQKGRSYEHEVSNEIARTDADVFAWPAGYSGNNAVPSPDVLTVTDGGAAGWELKKRGDYCGIDASELEQLLSLQRNFFDVGLVVKFSHREPLIVEPAFPSLPSFGLDGGVEPIENFMASVPSPFNGRRTEGGDEDTLRLSKPDLDDWPSAKAGQSAAEKIIERVTY